MRDEIVRHQLHGVEFLARVGHEGCVAVQEGGAVVHAVVVGREGEDETVEVGGGDAEGQACGCVVRVGWVVVGRGARGGGQAHQSRGAVAVEVEVQGLGKRGFWEG